MRFRLKVRLIALVSLVLASTIAVFAMRSASLESSWQEASRSVPPGLMQQIIQENFNSDFAGDSGQMKIWKISQSGQSKPLFLIDTRTANAATQPQDNPLCGALGCQFLG